MAGGGDADATFACSDAVDYARSVEEASETCGDLRELEVVCCPAPAERPCPFCEGGITGWDGGAIPGASFTCDDVAKYAVTIEGSSEACSGVKEVEAACCPTPADDPCSLCSEGVTAGDDFVIDGEDGPITCADAIKYAIDFEEASETCAGIKDVEALCCPTPAQNPCTLCAGGITAEEGFVLFGADGLTCRAFAERVATADASSEACADSQYAEVFCCPAPARRPCPVCAATGLTAAAGTPLSPDTDGATCGDLVRYAPGLEEASDLCATFREEAQRHCCPAPPGGGGGRGDGGGDADAGGRAPPPGGGGGRGDGGEDADVDAGGRAPPPTRGSKAGGGGKSGKAEKAEREAHGVGAPTAASALHTRASRKSKVASSTSKSSKTKASKAKRDASTSGEATARPSAAGESSKSASSTSKSRDTRFRGPQVSHRENLFGARFREP